MRESPRADERLPPRVRRSDDRALFEFLIRKLRELRETPKETSLERLIAVDGNGQSHYASHLAIDVVTTADTKQRPAMAF
jgi:hypothetical protein